VVASSVEELDELIKSIVREYNEEGLAPTYSAIRDGLRKRYSIERRVDKRLESLVRKGELIRCKLGSRKSAPAYYMLPGYELRLWPKFCGARVSEKHFRDIIEGLKELSIAYIEHRRLWSSCYGSESQKKAWYALHHILRGARFKLLRELLDSGKVDKFRVEAMKVADRLGSFIDQILEEYKVKSEKGVIGYDGVRFEKDYGSCEVCGQELTEEEEKIIEKWSEKLGTGFRRGGFIF